jgi:uncharacterized protein (UPF0332 family)
MNGRDFLTLAVQLSKESTEAAWRSAVSRAYYAVFHVARDLLAVLGFTVPYGDRAHSYLWMRLSNSSDPDIEDAGAALNTLRQNRNRSDYDLHLNVKVRDAQDAVQLAQGAIQTLDTASSTPLRTKITDAMKIYERDVLHDVTWHP